MGKKIFTILRSKFLFIKTYVFTVKMFVYLDLYSFVHDTYREEYTRFLVGAEPAVGGLGTRELSSRGGTGAN